MLRSGDNTSKLANIVEEYILECNKATGFINSSARESTHRNDPRPHIELELRFKNITRDIFISVISSAISSNDFGPGEVSHTLNAVSTSASTGLVTAADKPSSFIRVITYIDGVSTGNQYIKKTRVRHIDIQDFIDYRASVSVEQPITGFDSSLDAVLRFKNRISFTMKNAPWRLDITAVHQAQKSADLSALKKRMFVAGTTEVNYIDNLDEAVITDYQIELEYIGGCTKEIPFDVIKKIFGTVNPQFQNEVLYQTEIYNVAKYIIQNPDHLAKFGTADNRLKQLSNQVMTVNKISYNRDLYPPTGLFLTEKIDGSRTIISVNGNRVRMLTSSFIREFLPAAYKQGAATIADAEFVTDGDPSTAGGVFYLFDCMVIRDHNISQSGFEERVKELEAAAKVINEVLAACDCKIVAKAKKFVELGKADQLEAQIMSVWGAWAPTSSSGSAASPQYSTDGLIFTAPGESYKTTKNYKWKDFAHDTIDFTAMKCPRGLIGVAPYLSKPGTEIYFLFVGIRSSMRNNLGIGLLAQYYKIWGKPEEYAPVQFSPSINPYAYIYYHPIDGPEIDGKLVEMGRTQGDEWVLHRIRTDRTLQKKDYGNDFRTAENTYMNYINKFNIEDLWTPSTDAYFEADNDVYRPGNRCRRFAIKETLREHIRGAPWVVDLACGRGADITSYKSAGVKNLLLLDIDAAALSELVQRKFNIAQANPRTRIGGVDPGSVAGVDIDTVITPNNSAMTYHVGLADLKRPHEELLPRIDAYGAHPGTIPVVVCNLAIHYMCDTPANMRNLLDLVSKLLTKNGKFIFSTMDGHKIFELLKDLPIGASWKTMEGEAIKYSLTKRYSSDTFAAAGQMIDVKVPFSDKPYTEPLCNVDELIKMAKTRGLSLVARSSMGSFISDYIKSDAVNGKKLTRDDDFYTNLFCVVVLEKVKKNKSSEARGPGGPEGHEGSAPSESSGVIGGRDRSKTTAGDIRRGRPRSSMLDLDY